MDIIQASEAVGTRDRRVGERRKADLPFSGPDRRQGERRSGADRRETPRVSLSS